MIFLHAIDSGVLIWYNNKIFYVNVIYCECLVNMKFTVQNVGKIEHAVLQLNGITVVVGDNNAGKTTISRALYAFINSLCNIDAEVVGQRTHEITRLIRSFYSAFRRPFGFADRELRVAIERFVQNDNGQDDGFAGYAKRGESCRCDYA